MRSSNGCLAEIAARKYVIQEAVAAKMDRQPTVLLDILRAREQVLAGAFVQREMGAKSAGIGKGEIDNFIQAHPNQFASREEFDIDQISFQAPKEMDELVAATKDFKTLGTSGRQTQRTRGAARSPPRRD